MQELRYPQRVSDKFHVCLSVICRCWQLIHCTQHLQQTRKWHLQRGENVQLLCSQLAPTGGGTPIFLLYSLGTSLRGLWIRPIALSWSTESNISKVDPIALAVYGVAAAHAGSFL